MFKPKGVMFLTLVIMLIGFSCSGPESDQTPLTADVPLHLEEHLDAATIEDSEVSADLPAAIEWRFDEPQPDWKAPAHMNPDIPPLQLERTEDALRVTFSEANRDPRDSTRLHGDIYVDLPDLKRGDWGYIVVRARTSDEVQNFGVQFNLRDGAGPAADQQGMFRFVGENVNVINDGSVHTYLLRADWSGGQWEGPWQQLGMWLNTGGPTGIDLLSVSIIPKEANYAAAPAGVQTEVRNRAYRRTLYVHAPGRVEYRVRVPEAGRLDLGLGVLRDDTPVTFRITASPAGGEAISLLEETYADKERWAQRSVDLSDLAGQTVTLALEADAEKAGTVALWSAPTLTGAGEADRPNVIF